MTPEERAELVWQEYHNPDCATFVRPWPAAVAEQIRAAVAEEREACAHVADREASELDQWGEHAAGTAKSIAAAIRARP